jgi:ribosome-associated protein
MTPGCGVEIGSAQRVKRQKEYRLHMRTAHESARRGAAQSEHVSQQTSSSALVDLITVWLDEAKAERIVSIDLAGKSTIADSMIIASGRTDRHVGAIADLLQRHLKDAGLRKLRVEGMPTCDWVLIDTGDIVIHVFRPEVREFYNLEKMWSGDRPAEQPAH